MIYLVSLAVFTSVILALVLLLLFIETRVIQKGDRQIVINADEENALTVPMGTSLLSALVANEIYLPSACGGSGSCGQCRCRVVHGGGDILPTELPHLTRHEKAQNVRLACQLKIRNDMAIEIPPEIFSIKKYAGTVASNRNIGTFIKELVIDLDEPIAFEAGQYIQIDIPPYKVSFADFDIDEVFCPAWDQFNLWKHEAENDEPVYRAYSLANPPYENRRLAFTIRIATPPPDAPNAPPGIGSSYIFSLKSGDRVTLSGPFGDFMIPGEENRRAPEMCFLGGGAGMAPLRSQIYDQLLRVKTQRTVTFWYGARNRKEMLYDAEFRELDRRFSNFTYNVALSDPRADDMWEGMTGFVHQCAHDHYLHSHPDPTEIEYYLCGPPIMIEVTLQMLDSIGVESEMIAYDEFS